MDIESTTRSLYQRRGTSLHGISFDSGAMHQRRPRQVSQLTISRQASNGEERYLHSDPTILARQRRRHWPVQPSSSSKTHLTSLPQRPSAQPRSDTVLLSSTASTSSQLWLSSDDTATGPVPPALTPSAQSRSLSPSPLPTPTDPASLGTDYFSFKRSNIASTTSKTLEDQLYFAYADDNIRLAKIVFLKLKGINVTSEDDPRIDEVKEEDFDECFIPSGGLDLGGHQMNLYDGLGRERERREKRQRDKRLMECEQKWTEAKEMSRRERSLAQHTRKPPEEPPTPRGRKAEADPTKSSYHQRLRNRTTTRYLVTYSNIHSASNGFSSLHQSSETTFQYDCMPITKPAASQRRSPKLKDQELPRSTTVSFGEVLASMHGPLFPIDPMEQRMCRRSTLRCPSQERSRSSTPAELLADLLATEPEHERPEVKEPTYRIPRRTLSSASCAACSVASSPSSLARSESWLSMGSSECSSNSISTTATTPSTSPIYSWIKSNTRISIRSRCEDLPKASSAPARHSCRLQRQLTPVAPADSPLYIVHPRTQSWSTMDHSRTSSDRLTPTPASSSAKDRTSCNTLVNRFSDLVSRAKEKVYIAAAASGVASSGLCDADTNASYASKLPLRTPGYRARREHVLVFLTPQPDDVNCNAQAIPLRCPSIPTTIRVPNHTRTFPPPPLLPRSPFRPIEPPGALSVRLRPIENPVNLRLRALQNVMCERGKEWEGRAPDGALGCGRERLVGICWEGLGRSGLGLENRPVASF